METATNLHRHLLSDAAQARSDFMSMAKDSGADAANTARNAANTARNAANSARDIAIAEGEALAASAKSQFFSKVTTWKEKGISVIYQALQPSLLVSTRAYDKLDPVKSLEWQPVSSRTLHLSILHRRHVNLEHIQTTLRKSKHNYDLKTCVLRAKGKHEIVIPELAYWDHGPQDDKFYCGMKELKQITTMYSTWVANMATNRTGAPTPHRTVFMCYGGSEWIDYSSVTNVTKMINSIFQESPVSTLLKLVTIGKKDNQLTEICCKQSTREALVASHIPVVTLIHQYRGPGGYYTRTFRIDSHNTSPDLEQFLQSQGTGTSAYARSREGFVPEGPATARYIGARSILAGLCYRMSFELWKSKKIVLEKQDAIASSGSSKREFKKLKSRLAPRKPATDAEKTVSSTGNDIRINVGATTPKTWPRHHRILFYFGEKAYKSISKKIEEDASGDLQALFQLNLDMDLSTEERNRAELPKIDNDAVRMKRQQQRKTILVQEFIDAAEHKLECDAKSKFKQAYKRSTDRELGNDPLHGTARHIACIIDCRKKMNVKGVLVGDKVVWYDDGKRLKFNDGGVKIVFRPLVVGLSIIVGIALLGYYLYARQDKASLEDLLQTTFSNAWLYVTSVVLVFYRIFHKGEAASDVASFQRQLDNNEEWDRLDDGEKIVSMVQLLAEYPGGTSFVDRSSASYAREGTADGFMDMRDEMAADNLFLAGFSFVKCKDELYLKSRDGVLGMCVPVEDDEEGDSFRIGWPGVPILEHDDDDADGDDSLVSEDDDDDDDDGSDGEKDLETGLANADADAGAVAPVNDEDVEGVVYDFVPPPLESCQRALEPSWGFVE